MTTRTSMLTPAKKPKMKDVKPPKPKLGKKEPKSKKPASFTKGNTLEDAQRDMGKAANRSKRNKGRK